MLPAHTKKLGVISLMKHGTNNIIRVFLFAAAVGARCGAASILIRRRNFAHNFYSRLLFFLSTSVVVGMTVVVGLIMGWCVVIMGMLMTVTVAMVVTLLSTLGVRTTATPVFFVCVHFICCW